MKRNTLQRQIVMNALKKMHNHPTASQVYAYVRADYPTISKATVFRILNQESEEGTIMKVPVNDSEMHYELKNPPHYHLRGRMCGKVIDAPFPYQAHKEDVEQVNGFLIEGHSIEFYGICEECRKAEKGE